MKHNLSLYILGYMLRWTVGERENSFKLSEFRKENRIPYSTFNRHLSSLIRLGFVTKLGRDNYRVSTEFLRVCSNYSGIVDRILEDE